MTLYCYKPDLDRLDRWFEIDLNWQLMFGVRVNVDRLTHERPFVLVSIALGPVGILWTFPIHK